MTLPRKALFGLLTVLLFFAGLEAVLWFFGWPPPTQDAAFAHNEVYWIMDPDLRDESIPHRETGGSFTVSTDARGLRAPLHDLQKPEGVERILFLGCSTTFGWGVDDAETYPAQVASLLAEREIRGYQVINGGQPGYTSFQGRWFYPTVARDYDPDVVVFGYVVQDARKAAYTDRSQALLQQDARFLKERLLYRSRLYLGLRRVVASRQMASKEREEGDEQSDYRVPPEDYVANIRALHAMTREDDARLVLFGFPLERAGYTAGHRRLLRIAGEELGLPHFDPQPAFESLTRTRTLYFPEDRGHANEQGHALIARQVLSFLQEEGLVAGGP